MKKKIILSSLTISIIILMTGYFFLAKKSNKTAPLNGDLKLDALTDRNKPPKTKSYWARLPTKEKKNMLEFEKYSPNNSYNPYPDLDKIESKQRKYTRLKKEALLRHIKLKKARSEKFSAKEQKIYLAYLRKDFKEQIDLLKFILIKEAKSLTDEVKSFMRKKIQNLRKEIIILNHRK